MDTLDGFILNVFRTEKPVLSQTDFANESVWVCDLLNQDPDLANEYIKYKLSNCFNVIEKLQFLYNSRSCFKYEVDLMKNENWRSIHDDKEQLNERLKRYTNALSMTDQAICHYIDCSKLDCTEDKCFQLSKKKGVKTDLIRILNAVYELRIIENKNGQIPSKEDFMKRVGDFFGTDLSKYDIDLSQSLNNTSLEANIKVFEEMKNITQNSHYTSTKKK